MSHVADTDSLEFKATLPADYVGENTTVSGLAISGFNGDVEDGMPHVANKDSLEFKSTIPTDYIGENTVVSGPVDNGFTLM